MFRATRAESRQPRELDRFDRVVIVYLVLPLPIFLLGWLELWAAVPLTLCVFYALAPLAKSRPAEVSSFPFSVMQLTVACLVGCGWTAFGGIGHLVFANFDWHTRDAVLHDLVVSAWPVGYGVLDGRESLLRAPLGYYLPAALVGKAAGLWAAHAAMALWTAAGASLFLLQALSVNATRKGAALAVAALVVFFSGFDVVGAFITNPGRFLAQWNIADHLEWWAGRYQYSSLTTQLFWVPNHALAGWLTIGLLARDSRRSSTLDALLPMILVASTLWSPLTALGLVPFLLLRVLDHSARERLLQLLHPRVWAPAGLVGLAIAGYLTLDSGRIPGGLSLSRHSGELSLDLVRQLQFFLLEAGLIGFTVLALRWSWEVVLALGVLLLLPLVSFGPGNDLVMRASIPSLVVLALGVCGALTQQNGAPGELPKKVLLGCMAAVGAVTPIQEFARAILLPPWPINMEATLIGASCGDFLPHYTARLDGGLVSRLLRRPQRLALGPQGPQSCRDPALIIMQSWHVK